MRRHDSSFPERLDALVEGRTRTIRARAGGIVDWSFDPKVSDGPIGRAQHRGIVPQLLQCRDQPWRVAGDGHPGHIGDRLAEVADGGGNEARRDSTDGPTATVATRRVVALDVGEFVGEDAFELDPGELLEQAGGDDERRVAGVSTEASALGASSPSITWSAGFGTPAATQRPSTRLWKRGWSSSSTGRIRSGATRPPQTAALHEPGPARREQQQGTSAKAKPNPTRASTSHAHEEEHAREATQEEGDTTAVLGDLGLDGIRRQGRFVPDLFPQAGAPVRSHERSIPLGLQAPLGTCR